MTDFPSSAAARKCLLGQGCSDNVYWFLRRVLSVNAALRFNGEKKGLWRKSIYASAAVEAFIFAWTATHMDEPQATLPSSTAAENGSLGGIAATFAGRSAILAAGLWLAGDRKNVMKHALTSSALIQASVMVWAATKES